MRIKGKFKKLEETILYIHIYWNLLKSQSTNFTVGFLSRK